VIQWLETFQETFSPLLFEKLAEIECYVSLAYFFKHTTQSITWPEFDETVQACTMELPTKMTNIEDWVKNNSTDQFILLKGSNGSGKTSYMRTLAINLLLAHCGLPVFATNFQTNILDSIFMRIGSSDCLAEGKSSFVVEMQHMKSIADTMTSNSALFIDELGCSCDGESGKKICEYFINKIQETGCLCVFATHFDLKAEIVKEMGMNDGNYTYRIQDYGKNNSNKNAIAVAERCGFPSSVLYFAERLLI
jgi:DNA mismatch repair protein MutS